MHVTVGQHAARSLTLTEDHVRKYAEITCSFTGHWPRVVNSHPQAGGSVEHRAASVSERSRDEAARRG